MIVGTVEQDVATARDSFPALFAAPSVESIYREWSTFVRRAIDLRDLAEATEGPERWPLLVEAAASAWSAVVALSQLRPEGDSDALWRELFPGFESATRGIYARIAGMSPPTSAGCPVS